ncbi:MAG: AAA family ATPase [Ruminococcaceae bacterium]|nr:AAA family ATPase [Oscillospiraceae bacterium]
MIELSYSDAVFSKAYSILDERRMKAERKAEDMRLEIYDKIPRTEEIEKELQSISINAARAALSGGNAKELILMLKSKSDELRRELKSLITAAGYSEDALEVHYTCPECQDRGTVELNNTKTVFCQCFLDLLKECACHEVSSLSPLNLSKFEDFDLSYYSDEDTPEGVNPRRRMTQIFNYCKAYAKNFRPDTRSILMRGATGLGKTHLSLSIANELLNKGFSVAYVSAPDILFQLERAHFSYDYQQEEELLSTLSDCDLLIIDDLGTEFSTNYTNTQIYNIFNNRILRSKPVIINTNLTIKELESAYTQRFVSRIMGTCDKLDFVGKDIRPRKS